MFIASSRFNQMLGGVRDLKHVARVAKDRFVACPIERKNVCVDVQGARDLRAMYRAEGK